MADQYPKLILCVVYVFAAHPPESVLFDSKIFDRNQNLVKISAIMLVFYRRRGIHTRRATV